jgi:hypothetical protein
MAHNKFLQIWSKEDLHSVQSVLVILLCDTNFKYTYSDAMDPNIVYAVEHIQGSDMS